MAEPDLRLLAFNMLSSTMQSDPAIADYLLQSDADRVLLERVPSCYFLRRLKPATRFKWDAADGEGDVIVL